MTPHLRAARTAKRPEISLDAIVAYDMTWWPVEYARRHFIDTDQWRESLDVVTARRTVDGDRTLLDRYLAAFAPVPEELRGVLTAMTGLAVTAERTAVFHQVWPGILDALLPEGRQLQPVEGEEASDLDIELLDEALLPLPPDGAPWPTDQTARVPPGGEPRQSSTVSPRPARSRPADFSAKWKHDAARDRPREPAPVSQAARRSTSPPRWSTPVWAARGTLVRRCWPMSAAWSR